MVKSETRQDAEILVRNPSPRLFGKKFRDSKKVKTNHEKTRLETYQKRFRDFEIPPKFSETHVFQGTIRHPYQGQGQGHRIFPQQLISMIPAYFYSKTK